MFGDMEQQKPIQAVEFNGPESFMERIFLMEAESDFKGNLTTTLKTQYRMHPDIWRLSNEIFYGNQIKS